LREFLSASEGNEINITGKNLTELDRLCNEFVFTQHAGKLADFRSSMHFKEGKGEADQRDKS
jgi:hypothetical protein